MITPSALVVTIFTALPLCPNKYAVAPPASGITPTKEPSPSKAPLTPFPAAPRISCFVSLPIIDCPD